MQSLEYSRSHVCLDAFRRIFLFIFIASVDLLSLRHLLSLGIFGQPSLINIMVLFISCIPYRRHSLAALVLNVLEFQILWWWRCCQSCMLGMTEPFLVLTSLFLHLRDSGSLESGQTSRISSTSGGSFAFLSHRLFLRCWFHVFALCIRLLSDVNLGFPSLHEGTASL